MSSQSLARRLLAAALVTFLAPTTPRAQTKLLRFPDIHGDVVAFCYAGDLWLAPSAGGSATRLTAHPGLELFPRFSPDGKWIAFTGQYDGDEQVYVIPARGGEPTQLTFYPARGPLPARWGYDNQVYGWSRDGKDVLFRSLREGWTLTDTRLYLVPLEGGAARALPMPVAGGGDLSPDGKKVVYSPLTRDFRTWKRYEGGWAQDLFVFDLESKALAPLAHHARTERDPMWIGESIYFCSDRTGTLNLFACAPSTGAVTQLTHSTTWDVRWPARGEDGEIVYESAGELAVFDTRAGSTRKLDIFVPDDGNASRPGRVHVGGQVHGFALSPKGERALLWARGDVFTAPIEKGAPRNLTRSSNAHDREAEWSPDGKTVAFVSDASGEDEVWTAAQDGSAAPERLTTGNAKMLYGLRWSPDSKRIAFHDCTNRLHVVDVASKVVREVARNLGGSLVDYTWSPDSAWLAFSLTGENDLRALFVWGEGAGLQRVTEPLWNAFEPVWDPQGKYLFYLSDREFQPQLFTGFEWNFAINRTTGVFALALRKDVPHPFGPQSDEVTFGDDKKDDAKKDAANKDEGKGKDDAKKPIEPVRIDLDGLGARVARVPVDADNNVGLAVNDGFLFFVRVGAPYYGRESDRKGTLMVFDRDKRKAEVLAEDCRGYTLSADGKKLLARIGEALTLLDAKVGGDKEKKTVATSNLFVERVPRQEWEVVFKQVWRRFRDFFYVENMHGYDWAALRQQYEALLPYVAHRADLNYVIGEMIAELNVGHAYKSGGDWFAPERPKVALLGARLELDPQAQRYRIAKILAGHNEEPRYRSPLTEVGVDVKVGDYLLAVDGEDLTAGVNPYRLLRHKFGRPLELLVGITADKASARKVVIEPIDSEEDLNYLDWVLDKRARVAKASGGRLGYVHVPDMGENGIREFIKWFYGQVRLDGLIIDDRNNGGGNVSQMLIERLRRVLLGTGFARNTEYASTYPSVVFTGPMVCLLNENSASDGDIFPWMFKQSGLGPLIGKRSWGGVVGITSRGPLIDGGQCNVPEFSNNDAQGAWAVEGHGVDPDIVVENDAAAVLAGRDPQLERAIEELRKLVAQRAAKLPARPAPPIKTR
jgi:tricorn protease